jgi:signal-transduction protein with cAMP-binding, CBS, and nucleotidyltransferase domain
MPTRTVRTIVAQQTAVTVPSKTTVEAAARLMKKKKVGALMVVDDAKLVGIFTERDALFRVLAENRDPHTTKVATVMTPDPRSIHPDKPFGNALFMMYEGGFRHVPVVENGRALGMVSARDALGPELEEFGAEMLHREQIAQILA